MDYADLYHYRRESTRYVVTTQWEEDAEQVGMNGAELDGYADTALQALAYAFEQIGANSEHFNRPHSWFRIDVFRIDTWVWLHDTQDVDEDEAAFEEEGDVLHFDTGPLYDETPENGEC